MLRQEHLQFLEKSLMPLHRPKSLSMYHQQLAYCVMQYIEKDVAMSVIVVEGLIKSWPWTSSSKQVRRFSKSNVVVRMVIGVVWLCQTYVVVH